MSLIERYIYAVTRHMPAAQRQDVSDELRATIEDTLDEKKTRSKKNIEAVLIDLGDPEILARRYSGAKQYLIGPTFYIYFIRALKLSLAIGLPIAFCLILISQIVAVPESLISLLISTIGATIGVGIQILFWTALVFFVMERSGVSSKDLGNGNWTPSALPQIPMKRQIPISEVVTDIVTYGFLALSPLFLQKLVGVYSGDIHEPFFNPAIPSFWIPIIVGFGILGIIKGLIKLRARNWTPLLALFNIVFAIAISAALITAFVGTEIVNPTFLSILQTHIDTTTSLSQLILWTQWTIGISILVTIGIYLYDAAKSMVLAYKK